MRLGRLDIPCGCNERKDIIFEDGNPGIAEGAILAGAIVLIIIAWRLNK